MASWSWTRIDKMSKSREKELSVVGAIAFPKRRMFSDLLNQRTYAHKQADPHWLTCASCWWDALASQNEFSPRTSRMTEITEAESRGTHTGFRVRSPVNLVVSMYCTDTLIH